MAVNTIASYYARWSLTDHNGYIALKRGSGTTVKSWTTSNKEEFMLVCDLLRNERPLKYNSSNGRLYTSLNEPVGEEES